MRNAARPFRNHGKRIGVFVIAYNAESHIHETLDRIPDEVWDAVTVVYVVDDCSIDETIEEALACDDRSGKLVVIRNRVNRRYGGNQKFGYQYAIDQNLDAVVMLHADGQYAPEHLPEMLAPILEEEAEVVLGSRMMAQSDALKGGMPRYKFLANIGLTRLQNALSGMRLSEFHSGYRAYSVAWLKTVPFWENTDEWHFDTQILLQAKQSGARIHEIPIPTFYGDEICHVNGIAYGLNCIRTTTGHFLYRRGLYYSRKYDLNAKGQIYFSKFDDPFSSHSLIWKRLGRENLRGLRVLELGVGDASMTRRLKEMGAVVDGVEVDPLYRELAGPFCRMVYGGDLNGIAEIGLKGPYDIILAADVLEHLVEPEIVLSKLKCYLRRGGLLIVSLPNTANLYVRLSLLLGRFNYHTKGILDRTHLRFFTRASARLMLRKTGWQVEECCVTAIPVGVVFPFLSRMPMRLLLNAFFGLTRTFKCLLGYQVLFYCRNPNRPELL